MYYKSGNRYEGDFKNDKQEGKQFLFNGDIYEGDFKSGQREGKGIMIYKSGNKYV